MLPDLDAWAAEVARVLRPASYFARSHVNDTFPARGAAEHQRTLAEVVVAVVRLLARRP